MRHSETNSEQSVGSLTNDNYTYMHIESEIECLIKNGFISAHQF